MLKKIFRSYKSREQKKENRKELLFGLISGILLALSFPPIPMTYLIFSALIPYLIVIEKRNTLAEINRFTYFTIFFFNIFTLYWVGSWTKDADPFLMLSGSILMFFNPIVFLIPSTLYYFAKKYLNKNIALFLLPWFWLFYEYIYSITDFKFPWLSLSNALPYLTSYVQIVDIIGSYGLTVLIIYTNIFAYKLFQNYNENKKCKFNYAILFILILIIPIIYGMIKINNYKKSTKKVKVGLVQPNLNPNKKWEVGNLNEQINLYLELSNEAIKKNAELIIWPETALPVYLLLDSYKNETLKIQNFVDSNKISILTGMPHANFFTDSLSAPEDAKPMKNSKYFYTSYNSILFFSPNKKVEQYGKIKLVPFGEKVPLVDIFPVLGKWIKWNVGISSWNTGTDTVVFSTKNNFSNYKVGGVICIEAIYPDFISAFVDKGAEFISVVTNDSWYGNSSGPYQHKEIHVLRAVENRRSLVRAANGGISCIINPLGETLSDTKMFTKTILVGDVELRSDKTFFTEHPLLLPYISIVITFFVIISTIIGKFFNKK
ncbi:MAG: apolipoprotein N-acyltransferase [Ignavibacteriae bacterium]|nr:apolipoprotein N-acyltransferase [Ignavibacteriota bacterium]